YAEAAVGRVVAHEIARSGDDEIDAALVIFIRGNINDECEADAVELRLTTELPDQSRASSERQRELVAMQRIHFSLPFAEREEVEKAAEQNQIAAFAPALGAIDECVRSGRENRFLVGAEVELQPAQHRLH